MSQITPPHWIQSLLRKFANPATLEEIEGDLLEFYRLWVNQYGRRRANQKYILTALTLFRPFKIERTPSILPVMIQSYFKMSWRTILKNKVSSFLNISGLTLGLTTSLLILLVVLDEFAVDQFHENRETIFAVLKNQKTNGGISTDHSTPGPLAEALRYGFPEVKHAARLAWFFDLPVDVNGKKQKERGLYTEPDLFRMMTFPAIAGDPVKSLESNAEVVITQKMANKLFGDENPLGKTIAFNRRHVLTVGAIIANLPTTSSIQFDMVIPFGLYEKEKENAWLTKWDDNRINTYVQLNSAGDVPQFDTKVTELLIRNSEEDNTTGFAYPLTRLHLHGSFSNGHPDGGKILMVQLLIGFGVFMLIIACINFMNIATAQSEYRAKEVGVRKVMGASRKLIMLQFLNESFVITFLSLATSIGLAVAVIPSFNTLMHASISFNFMSGTIWLFVICIGLITSLVAGSYPSVALSSFLPALVLKGRISNRRGLQLRRILVTFQFAISILVLTGTVILYAQLDHLRNRPIGYDQQNLVGISLDSALSAKFPYIKNEIAGMPAVKSVTGIGGNILYSWAAVSGMEWPDKKPGEDLSVSLSSVEYDWAKTMGISIMLGRDFDPSVKSDEQGCLINKSAMNKMGLTNPIGGKVGGHTILGVFEDYVFNNPSGSVAPMMITFEQSKVSDLYLRIENDSKWLETMTTVEKMLKTLSPGYAFSFRFIKDEYQNRFNELADGSLMVSIFGGMTIFISCLGLFGLAGFVAEKRSKEMSIRKIFGATSLRILVSLTRDFLKPVIIALILMIPVTAWIAEKALSSIVYRVELSWTMFAYAGVIIIAIASMIVLYHGWRTASENPAKRLKSE